MMMMITMMLMLSNWLRPVAVAVVVGVNQKLSQCRDILFPWHWKLPSCYETLRIWPETWVVHEDLKLGRDWIWDHYVSDLHNEISIELNWSVLISSLDLHDATFCHQGSIDFKAQRMKNWSFTSSNFKTEKNPKIHASISPKMKWRKCPMNQRTEAQTFF